MCDSERIVLVCLNQIAPCQTGSVSGEQTHGCFYFLWLLTVDLEQFCTVNLYRKSVNRFYLIVHM